MGVADAGGTNRGETMSTVTIGGKVYEVVRDDTPDAWKARGVRRLHVRGAGGKVRVAMFDGDQFDCWDDSGKRTKRSKHTRINWRS